MIICFLICSNLKFFEMVKKMQFCNSFLFFNRENLKIAAHQYITKTNIVCRYYLNGIGETLFALMTQTGKGKPKWSLYDPNKKKIGEKTINERIILDFPNETNLFFHDQLIDWGLEESIKHMDSRLFLIENGYNSAQYRSIDDPWEPVEYFAED